MNEFDKNEQIENMQDEIDRLKQQIEAMRDCRNCKYVKYRGASVDICILGIESIQEVVDKIERMDMK
jgi:hypothetical protein